MRRPIAGALSELTSEPWDEAALDTLDGADYAVSRLANYLIAMRRAHRNCHPILLPSDEANLAGRLREVNTALAKLLDFARADS